MRFKGSLWRTKMALVRPAAVQLRFFFYFTIKLSISISLHIIRVWLCIWQVQIWFHNLYISTTNGLKAHWKMSLLVWTTILWRCSRFLDPIPSFLQGYLWQGFRLRVAFLGKVVPKFLFSSLLNYCGFSELDSWVLPRPKWSSWNRNGLLGVPLGGLECVLKAVQVCRNNEGCF